MSHLQEERAPNDRYELRFHSLHEPGRGVGFPCDACGQVDMDALSDGQRHHYMYARAMIGREISRPAVQRLRDSPWTVHPSTFPVVDPR